MSAHELIQSGVKFIVVELLTIFATVGCFVSFLVKSVKRSCCLLLIQDIHINQHLVSKCPTDSDI